MQVGQFSSIVGASGKTLHILDNLVENDPIELKDKPIDVIY